MTTARRSAIPLTLAAIAAFTIAACSTEASSQAGASGDGSSDRSSRTLRVSSIPDQDPDQVAERDRAMADYLAGELDVPVEYVPVTDYAASVSLFKTGDLDLVFFGGLTGVQARLESPGSTLIAQRDIDDSFESVFIANAAADIEPVDSVAGLTAFEGKRFTFGSESSTSGRLMPEYFLEQAGVTSASDFLGPPGYSGSHDKTIDLVQSGTFEGGALNRQVWDARVADGTVDLSEVAEVFVTPPYHDYHWIAGPETDERFGAGLTEEIKTAMLGLDYGQPDERAVLDGYGAKSFIATSESNYRQIEEIGRKLNLIS